MSEFDKNEHTTTVRHYGPNETGFVEFPLRLLTQRIFKGQIIDCYSHLNSARPHTDSKNHEN